MTGTRYPIPPLMYGVKQREYQSPSPNIFDFFPRIVRPLAGCQEAHHGGR